MQQNTELDRVKARIRALADKTVSRGCTEAEALAAAEMVGKLLDRYGLTMAEVDVREAACVQLVVATGVRQRRPVDGCVTAIARFCDTRVWLTREATGSIAYVFFGFETDTLLARYLFQIVDAAIAGESEGFGRRRPDLRDANLRRARQSFQHGMAARVAERLEAMLSERAASVAGKRADGRALAVVKQTVIEAAFRDAGPRLTTARNPVRKVVHSAFRDGLAAGERVNLNRPVAADRAGLLK